MNFENNSDHPNFEKLYEHFVKINKFQNKLIRKNLFFSEIVKIKNLELLKNSLRQDFNFGKNINIKNSLKSFELNKKNILIEYYNSIKTIKLNFDEVCSYFYIFIHLKFYENIYIHYDNEVLKFCFFYFSDRNFAFINKKKCEEYILSLNFGENYNKFIYDNIIKIFKFIKVKQVKNKPYEEILNSLHREKNVLNVINCFLKNDKIDLVKILSPLLKIMYENEDSLLYCGLNYDKLFKFPCRKL